jgi:hypothetical protein
MTGMNGRLGSAFSSRHTWMPSLPGIMTSSRIRSGDWCRALISASSPSLAVITS